MPNFTQIIKNKAALFGLDPILIAAIIAKESDGNLYAIRFEPDFYENKLKGRSAGDLSGYVSKRASFQTELIDRAHSWGLMQCMGESARCYGKFEGEFLSELMEPAVGIEVGCRIFSHFLRLSSAHIPALSMWNAGSIASSRGKEYAKSVIEIMRSGERFKEFYYG